jgi:hypothetical protein
MAPARCSSLARVLVLLRTWALPSALALQTQGPDMCETLLKDGDVDWSRFQEEAREFGLALPSENRCAPRTQPPHRGKPMLWVHIHKAGGSFICGMANLNHELIVEGGNCNWSGHDGDGRLGQQKIPCNWRWEHFSKAGLTWGQIEREFGEGDFCPDFFEYGTTLRDPLSLALSEVLMVKHTHDEVQAHLDCVLHRTKDCTAVSKDGSNTLWRFFDNYQVRILGGPDVFFLPPGAVNQTHLKNAVRLLSQFKVVLRFEDIVSQPEALHNALGWSVESLAPTDPHGHTVKAWTFTDAEAAQIRRLTSLDAALHRDAHGQA